MRAAFMALAACLCFGGCSTQENFARIINEPAPVSPALRGRFGVVGLLPVAGITNFHLQQPTLPPGVASKMVDKTFRELESRIHPENEDTQKELARIGFSALVSLGVETAGALISGVPAAEMEGVQARLGAVLEAEPFQNGLQKEFQRVLAKRSIPQFKLLPDSSLTNVALRNFRMDFSALSAEGLDSVLDIRVTDLAFRARDGIDPPMTFAPQLTVYVFRVSDGAVLHASNLDYRGAMRRIREWADKNAAHFRSEVSLAEQTFVSTLLDEYLGVDATPTIKPAE